LEAARGISRLVTRADHNMANAQARRDLQRLAANGDAANHLSVLYLSLLTVISTPVYVAPLAALVGRALLLWSAINDRAWLEIALCVLLGGLIIYALLPPRQKTRGSTVTRERFLALMAPLDEVAKCVALGCHVASCRSLVLHTQCTCATRCGASSCASACC
jgi:hypothetical protein